jgi:hypothetical protein
MSTQVKIIMHNHTAFLRAACLGAALILPQIHAQDAAPDAKDLAARLSANVLDGSSLVRLKMEIKQGGGEKVVLQLQVKARRTNAASDVMYQVLWPKDRKGESFLVKKSAGGSLSGSIFVPPNSVTPISSDKMKGGVFGSDLAYEDLVGNFFGWPQQAIVGTEVVDRVPCQILESKPGKGDHSSYSHVRSWIDTKRTIPLKIEKYSSGQMVSRIITTRVAEDDTNRKVPASLSLQRAGQNSVTEIEGSNSRHDVSFSDADFSPEALRALSGAGAKSN